MTAPSEVLIGHARTLLELEAAALADTRLATGSVAESPIVGRPETEAA